MQTLGPGWSWDATWWIADIRHAGDTGWRWDAKLETCMVVTWDIDGHKSWISGYGWRWKTPYMEVGEMLGPGLRWDVTWMKVWYTSQTWLALRWGLGRAEMQFLWPECRWDKTLVEVRCEYWELDRVVTQISRPELGELGPGWGAYLEA